MPVPRASHLKSMRYSGWLWTAGSIFALLLLSAHSSASQAKRIFVSTSQTNKPAADSIDPQAFAVVQTMLRAQRTLAYSGEQVTTLYTPIGPTNSSEQTVMHNGIKGMRLDYHSPDRLAGESRGDNGRVLWHNNIRKHHVDRMQSALSRLSAEIRQAETEIRNKSILLHVLGEDTVAGRHAVIVQASVAGAGGNAESGARRFWIDPATGAQLRIVIFGPTGTPVSDSYFTQITYSPSFAPGIFDPPANAPIAAAPAEQPVKAVGHVPSGVVPELGFRVLEPAYLPPGYRFDSGQLFQFKGSPAFGIRYINGLTVISLYETVCKRPNPRNHFTLNRTGMLTGVQSGIQVVLLGNVDPSDLIRMYQSLQ